MSTEFDIIGIGASAGGLEAIEALLTRIPPDTGKAFIVIQHLSPDFKSFMPEILARKTDMQIPVIRDGTQIKPNHIYLIPPKKNLTIDGNSIILCDIERSKIPNKPIDLLFQSLAQEIGPKATAVVLSGTGSDGSLGIQAVKRSGGKVYVESPQSARFDGMPTSAIATRCVDFIGTPEDIAVKLGGSSIPMALNKLYEPMAQDNEESDRYKLLHLIQEHYGVNFGQYKIATVNRRIDRRLQELKLPSLQKYLTYIKSNPKEVSLLYYEMLIGVTQFFRDEGAFASLAREVIPKLVSEAREEIRVWIPGCASGEEAYSIGILIHEEKQRQASQVPYKIFATDIDDVILSKAAAGVYPKEALEDISKDRLHQFFRAFRENYKISSEIRKSVVFARHNVLIDPPFTKLDLISCRNLLIYLGEEAQSSVRSSFCLALKDSGFLFLGPSEAIGKFEVIFEPLDKRWKIFRKVSSQRIPREFQYQVLKQGSSFAYSRQSGLNSEERQKDLNINSAMHALLQAYVPPSILVTEDLSMLHVFGDMGMHLHFKPGQTNLNLSNMLDERLLSAISITIQRVKKQHRPVSYSNIAITYGTETNLFDLMVRPVFLEKKAQSLFYLVAISKSEAPVESLLPSTETGKLKDTKRLSESNYSKEEADLLRGELRRTKEDLQATIEELETTNEELQSTNEEMLAANEELQSTNEELHSVNEELYTVNAEYQKKIDELIQLSQDEENLLKCTQIATVFLDAELRVRKFTPSISTHFNLLPLDIGRPFSHITHNIQIGDLDRKIDEVLHTSKPIEVETANDLRFFILRILPYQTEEHDTDGVVLTFTDITDIKRASQNALETAHRAEAVSRELKKRTHDLEQSAKKLEAMKDRYDRLFREIKIPIIIAEGKIDGKVLDANYKALELFSIKPDEIHQKHLNQLIGSKPTYKYAKFFEELKSIKTEEPTYEFVTEIKLDKQERTINVILSSILVEEQPCIQAVLRDITEESQLREIKEEAEQARRSTHFKSKFLANMSHEIRTPLNSVLGMSELLSETNLNSIQSNYCDSIVKAGETLLSIVNDILDLSKIESGEMPLEAIEFDLIKAVEDVYDLLKSKAMEKNLEFKVSFSSKTPRFVIGDSTRIKQILINLVNNAIKFTKKGSVVLSTEAIINNNNATIEFTIEDTGIGIPKQYHDAIFQSFNQADSSMTRRFGGTGLGLAIVKSLTEMMNGTVNLVSDENKGTTFTVKINLEPSSRKIINGHILLVTENKEVKESIESNLKNNEFTCTSTDDPHDAYKETQKSKFDVVIYDLKKSAKEGLDFFANLRSLGASGSFILLTEQEDQLSFAQAKEVNLFDVIFKPVDPGNLITSINKAVRRIRDTNFRQLLDDNLKNVPALEVLVVEDVHYNRTMVEAFLSQSPFNLTFAENGLIAVELFKSKRFHVVLMDIQMPIMDGHEATKEIRRYEGDKMHTPIIALTAHALEEEKRKCLASGCDDYLTKPVKKNILIRAILEQTNHLI